MTIKDILKAAAALLNQTEVCAYLSGDENSPSADTLSIVNAETRLANLVISELSAGYAPLVYSESVTAENGKIFFADFKYSATRIISVKDSFDEDARYALHSAYIETESGDYTVKYEYAPASFGLENTLEFDAKIMPSLIAYGVAAEYCVTQGRFEEAIMWRKRYSDGVERVVLPDLPTIKGRCWL